MLLAAGREGERRETGRWLTSCNVSLLSTFSPMLCRSAGRTIFSLEEDVFTGNCLHSASLYRTGHTCDESISRSGLAGGRPQAFFLEHKTAASAAVASSF